MKIEIEGVPDEGPGDPLHVRIAREPLPGGREGLHIRVAGPDAFRRVRVEIADESRRCDALGRPPPAISADMLVEGLAAALSLPRGFVCAFAPDERRVLGLLLLNHDSLLSAADLAHLLSGSFVGVSEEEVCLTIDAIRARLAAGGGRVKILGDVGAGFRLQVGR